MDAFTALNDLLSHDRDLLVSDDGTGLVSAEAYEALLRLRLDLMSPRARKIDDARKG